MLEAVADCSQAVRKAALTGLGRLAWPDNASSITEGLKSPKPATRVAAAFFLGQMTSPAKCALEDLQKALMDESQAVRFAAIKTLANLGEQVSSPPAADFLIDLLKTEAAATVNRRIAGAPVDFGFAGLTLQEKDIAWVLAKVQDQLGPLEESCAAEFVEASKSPEPVVARLANAWLERRDRSKSPAPSSSPAR
jgi:hypothetical protein